MRLKFGISFLSLFVAFLPVNRLLANMANPMKEGARISEPFVSGHARILSEKIKFTPDSTFRYCTIEVNYWVETDTSATQIPFLFLAPGLGRVLNATLDSEKIELKPVPEKFRLSEADHTGLRGGEAVFMLSPGVSRSLNISELIYFDLDLPAGRHHISICYAAVAWEYIRDFDHNRSFRYSLYPARYWKSFGSMETEFDLPDGGNEVYLSFSNAEAIKLQSDTILYFDTIPGDILILEKVLAKSPMSGNSLLREKFAGLVWLALFLLFSGLIYNSASHKQIKKTTRLMKTGMVMVPLATMVFYVSGIKYVLQIAGVDFQGYPYDFLAYLALPVLIPVHWLLFYLFYKYLKQKFGIY